jgi:AbiU2
VLTELGKSRREVEYLATQLGLANTFLYLFRGLRAAQQGQHHKEMHPALDFWNYTISAHIQAAIAHLCRLYDSRSDTGRGRALHLLDFVKHVDRSKLKGAEAALYKADLQFLHKGKSETGAGADPVVTKLRMWRDNLIAHRNYHLSLGGVDQFLKEFPVDLDELQRLIDRGFEILDRWKHYYQCESEFPRFPSGKDDYRFVLAALQQSHKESKPRLPQGEK